MPNIATALKEEISRLARKELRQEVDALKKASTQYRLSISALKRDMASLERELKRLKKSSAKQSSESPAEEPGKQIRFSAERLAAHRQKLGLSAKDYASLLGVSPLTVYKWEKGETRPRASQLPAIAYARTLGKREAAKQLEATSSG